MSVRASIVVRIALITFAVLAPAFATAQNLCPPRKPLPEDQAPELQMTESDFTAEKGIQAAEWLEKDVWEVIKQSKTTEELLGNTEGFGIPFPNTVTVAKGTILRQRALLERQLLEIARLKLNAGTGTEAAVAAAQRRYTAARKAFCSFLDKAEWVD
jgi:hypothetical protein